MTIPSNASELTPAWMSEALGATVVAVDATPIGVGVGLMGALCRVSVTYAEPTASRPATLIAKFPAEGDASRMVAELLGMYRKEVRFYEQLAKRAGIPHAECYYAELDDETQRFVLLLSDLANGRVVDQLEGCKLDDARLAVERLADLHASFWNDSEVATADWMGALCDSPFPEGVVFSYQTSWGPAQELFGDQMPPAIKDLGDRFDGLLPRIMQRLSEGPTTLSHGDYRLDNIFFYDTDLAVCDWQLVDRSRGARDLGYFLGGSLTAADRAAHERDLVAAYAARLAANGVANYDFATCWEDYRLAVLFSFVYGIVAAGGLDHGDPRGTAITGAMIERSVAAILELECLSLPEAAS